MFDSVELYSDLKHKDYHFTGDILEASFFPFLIPDVPSFDTSSWRTLDLPVK